MKIYCDCGGVMYDSTDKLPNKAYFIPDKKRFKCVEQLNREIADTLRAISSEGFENWAMKHFKNQETPDLEGFVHYIQSECRQRHERTAYQCSSCSSLYVDNKDHELIKFIPASNTEAKDLFDVD